ncbi:MAG: hypothetical protein Q8P41_17550 [Pseudomonadota bacterium]|nr:hypothetical protein [Pseudomonadota bacterium]
MSLILLLLAACTGRGAPDPDAKLRGGDLDGAAAAWQAAHGEPLDLDHPAAQALALRAPRDPSITTASLADTVAVARFLEQAPIVRTQSLDLSFARMADLGAALDALAVPPALFAIGRSESLGDRDPYLPGAALPWKGGRIVGWARLPGEPATAGTPGPLEAFGATLDANAPAKLVTIGVSDASGDVYLNVERREDAWWVVAASNADAGARLVLAAESVRDYGGATLRTREGEGFVRR